MADPLTFDQILPEAWRTPIGGGQQDPYALALAEFATLPTPIKSQSAYYGANPELAANLRYGVGGTQKFQVPTVDEAGNEVMQEVEVDIPAAQAPVVGFVVAPSGRVRFWNGVIMDPGTRTVIFRPNDAEVVGSEAWLRAIQDDWDDKEIGVWRKRLADEGYEVSEKGDWALDLIDALRDYHFNRYLNFGKPQPKGPVNQQMREAIREQVDFKSIKEGIKSSWGDAAFGQPLNDALADYLAERVIRQAAKLKRKHPGWTVGAAIGSPGSTETLPSGAFLRVQEEFSEMPEVKAGLREGERIEERTGLRERLETAARVYNQL